MSSVKVEMDHKGESKGFGFVCFKESDDAKECIDKANKLVLDNGEELYVSKFEKKSERTRKLKMEIGKISNNENKNKNNL